MTDADLTRKMDEIDRLLNDPDVPMEPDRIWSMLAELAAQSHRAAGPAGAPAG